MFPSNQFSFVKGESISDLLCLFFDFVNLDKNEKVISIFLDIKKFLIQLTIIFSKKILILWN